MVQDDKAKDAEKRQNTTNKKLNNSVIYRTHLLKTNTLKYEKDSFDDVDNGHDAARSVWHR